MEEKLQMVRKIVPDLTEELVKRYRILKTVRLLEPCGRRLVVISLGMTERTVRSEIEKLNAQGLVKVSKTGMSVTEDGLSVLENLSDLFSSLTGMSELEEKVREILGAQRVLLAQGNSDESDRTVKEMAQIGARVLLENMRRSSRIAITGGTTMAALVEAMPYTAVQKAEMVLPARGSIGRKLELQADTLAAKLAEKAGADYRMLHLPDNLSANVLEEMKSEPEVAETINELKRVDILLLGVGDAMEMAENAVWIMIHANCSGRNMPLQKPAAITSTIKAKWSTKQIPLVWTSKKCIVWNMSSFPQEAKRRQQVCLH